MHSVKLRSRSRKSLAVESGASVFDESSTVVTNWERAEAWAVIDI